MADRGVHDGTIAAFTMGGIRNEDHYSVISKNVRPNYDFFK
jgi:hypothetical protein